MMNGLFKQKKFPAIARDWRVFLLAVVFTPAACFAGGSSESCAGTISAAYSLDSTRTNLTVRVFGEGVKNFAGLSSYLYVREGTGEIPQVIPGSDITSSGCVTYRGASIVQQGFDETTFLTTGSSGCSVDLTTKKLIYTASFKLKAQSGSVKLANRIALSDSSGQRIAACVKDPGFSW